MQLLLRIHRDCFKAEKADGVLNARIASAMAPMLFAMAPVQMRLESTQPRLGQEPPRQRATAQSSLERLP